MAEDQTTNFIVDLLVDEQEPEGLHRMASITIGIDAEIEQLGKSSIVRCIGLETISLFDCDGLDDDEFADLEWDTHKDWTG